MTMVVLLVSLLLLSFQGYVHCDGKVAPSGESFIKTTSTVQTHNISVSLVNGTIKLDIATNLSSFEPSVFFPVNASIYEVFAFVGDTNYSLGKVNLTNPDFYSLIVYEEIILKKYLLEFNQPTVPSMDTAWIRFADVTNSSEDIEVWGTDTDCYDCLYLRYFPYPTTDNKYVVDTDSPHILTIRKYLNETDYVVLHNETINFYDHAEYTYFIRESNATYFFNYTEDFPADYYWTPLIVAGSLLFGAAVMWPMVLILKRKIEEMWNSKSERGVGGLDDQEDQPFINRNSIQESEKPKPKPRLKSLDAFRGLAITIMIFVNYGGGGYWFFDHSKWNGLTFADLVFPWFIWIMGTSMAFALKGIENPKENKMAILWKIVRRSIILFALGEFLYSYNLQFIYWRIPGVLQRFSISYLVVGLIMFIPKIESLAKQTRFGNGSGGNEQERFTDNFVDFLPYLPQWIVVLVLLSAYLMITFLVNVPGCGAGYIGPGGIGDFGKFENCTGGSHGYIDRLIFGENHIYGQPTCQDLYHTGAYDPEGSVGSLTSIVLCFIGLQSGRIIVNYTDTKSRIKRWLCWGVFFGLMGCILCYGQKNGGPIPINKNLWSPSFIFVMAGTAFIVLTLFYILIDVFQLWNGAPVFYVGMNPIMLYCCHELLNSYFPFSFVAPNTHTWTLFQNLLGVSSWLVIAFRMHQLDFFVTI
eukprot:TRINITY_DN6539_c0_g1_i1.p1 TRINITY_DN6539_c0_g1~~TRINITY_DN6539_c0_g1_i1.p1  ORF type:complete len:697 (+),score=149.63 TRINITY_DN6539_c0_g1_i1:1577-3667(+)